MQPPLALPRSCDQPVCRPYRRSNLGLCALWMMSIDRRTIWQASSPGPIGAAEEHQSQPRSSLSSGARAAHCPVIPISAIRCRRPVSAARSAAARAADRLLEREAASREVSLGALQVWQALTERVSGKPANREVTLVFTDLVGSRRGRCRPATTPRSSCCAASPRSSSRRCWRRAATSSNGWATASWRCSPTRSPRSAAIKPRGMRSSPLRWTAIRRGCGSASTPAARSASVRTGWASTSTSPRG